MCYSAQCWTAYRLYVREFGARISIRDFAELYGYKKRAKAAIYTPKGMDDAFLDPQTPEEAEIRSWIDELNIGEARKFEEQLFTQRTRKVAAERALNSKVTKKAQEDVRIATAKIEQAEVKLDDLRRTDPKGEDSRIFPFWYAPVLIMEAGELVVKPMRYHCRLPRWNPSMERKYGTYNARRDSLGGTWRDIFGHQHGILVVNRFYENVSLHASEGRELRPGEKEQNVVLEFNPRPAHNMLVACLWTFSKGWGDETDFYSFAAITDVPPPEIAAAGHDRCIIAIKPGNLDAWLTPDPNNLDALQAILEDKDRPYYEHRLAA